MKILEVAKTKTFYHVTSENNLEEIMKHGLTPKTAERSSKLGEQSDKIYMFKNKIDAEEALMNWLGDEFKDEESLIILRIDLPGDFPVEQDRAAAFEWTTNHSIPARYIKIEQLEERLNESILDGAIGDSSKIQDYLSDIEEEQREIEDKTDKNFDHKNNKFKNEELNKKLEKEFQALEAIKYILKNNKNALENQKLMDESIFLYEIDRNGALWAALHAVIIGDTIDVKWIGSTMKGAGKKLVEELRKIAKEQHIKKIKLTSKWNSEGFYDKLGFKKSIKQENPLTRANNINSDYEQNINEDISEYPKTLKNMYEISDYILSQTPADEPFSKEEEENLWDEIGRNSYAVLEQVLISKIRGGDISNMDDKNKRKIKKYSKQDIKNMPPIVISEDLWNEIIDGYHRFEVVKASGQKTIWAYVIKEKDLKEESETISSFGGKYETKVLINPTPREAEGLFNNAVRLNLQRIPSEEGVLRYLYDAGDLYMWDAYHLIHSDIADYFGVKEREIGYVDTASEAMSIANDYQQIRERNKKKVRENIEWMGDAGTKFKVLVNPTVSQAVALYSNAKELQKYVNQPEFEQKFKVRCLNDGNNLYMWEAYYATHDDIIDHYGLNPHLVDDNNACGSIGSEKTAEKTVRDFYKNKNDEKKDLKEKIEKIAVYGGTPHDVLVNPTVKEITIFLDKVEALNDKRKNYLSPDNEQDGILRYFSDSGLNLYVADAYYFTHDDLVTNFGDRDNVYDYGYINSKDQAIEIVKSYQDLKDKSNLKEKIEVVPGHNGLEYKVLVNPTPDEAVRLFMNMKRNHDVMRFVSDDHDNLYIWDAFYLTHADVMGYYGIPDQSYDRAGVIHSAMDARRMVQAFDMDREHREYVKTID